MLEHGGKLIQAARQYNIPVKDWLDLSTGLNPLPWPADKIPIDAWARLPDENDGLIQAARDYYGGEQLLAVAGSQAAIQTLPRLRPPTSRIAILYPAYAEHAHVWHSNGFTVTQLCSKNIDEAVDAYDVIILVNPNNPTGECFTVEQCLQWHQRLQSHGGWLIIDEAFIDTTPEHSLVDYTQREGLVVLRSLGKFFGLAGARVGFVFATSTLLSQLAELFGPWPVSGPSRCIAKLALQDVLWQTKTRRQLKQQGRRLYHLLGDIGLSADGGTALFQWVKTTDAADIHQQLAKQGILVRLFGKPDGHDTCPSLRFGLPATEQQWSRLEQAL